SACANACMSDADCSTGTYCDLASGNCLPIKTGGAACAKADECQSAFCADGVCCDTACTGTCQACTAAKKGSGADGTCGTIAAGTDPDGECDDQGAPSCGTNGSCDGSGACAKYPMGTLCGSPSCSGSTETNAPVCDGAGTCTPSGMTSCAPYVCGMTVCNSMCATDTECVSGDYCSTGACVAKKGNGSTCAAADQCASGNCADGVCCNTAC